MRVTRSVGSYMLMNSTIEKRRCEDMTINKARVILGSPQLYSERAIQEAEIVYSKFTEDVMSLYEKLSEGEGK